MKKTVQEEIMEGISVVCTSEQFISAPEFAVYTQGSEFEEKMFEEQIDLLSLALRNENFKDLADSIKLSIENAYGAVKNHSEVFVHFLKVYHENIHMKVETFREKEIEEFRHAIEMYIKEEKELEEFEPTYNIKIMFLNAKKLYNT